MKLEPSDALELIKVAFEKHEEKKLWDLYVAKSILATKQRDFKDILEEAKSKANVNMQKTFDEAENIAEKAVKAFKGR